MNVVICGAGEVGRQAAEELQGERKKNVVVIDSQPERIQRIEETMDVRTKCGNCADASVLMEAGAASADLVVAATSQDEVNLLTAATAKALGAKMVVARAHHRAFFERDVFDYKKHFGIDRLICPERAAAVAIAGTVRNRGALKLESFAEGAILMQELQVSSNVAGVKKPLGELSMPAGSRIAAVMRGESSELIVPGPTTLIEPEDRIVLVANDGVFQAARKMFREEVSGRRKMVIKGGSTMAVWLCRALHDRSLSIRLFEKDKERATELANKLDWVTVLNTDPTDPNEFEDEHLFDADVFVAVGENDEENILSCALAKKMGVKETVAVVQGPKYEQLERLLSKVGINHVFQPRHVAVREIEDLIDDDSISTLASLTEGAVNVYRVRIGASSSVIDKPLREASISDCLVVSVPDDGSVRLPGPDDRLQAGDTVLVVGRHGMESTLQKIFDAR